MATQHAQETISPAVAGIINSIADDQMRLRVDILVARSVGALTAARRMDFVGFEERELNDGSLELWNEVAPVFGSVFKELHSLMDAALELFPRSADAPAADADAGGVDLDAAFDMMETGGSTAAPAGTAPTPAANVADLVQSYAWAIKQSIQDEARKLREPTLMVAQWNLLGELEEFRDRTVGALHGMVAAVLGTFEDVDVESLFPAAAERVEMGVALRAEVAQLCRALDFSVAAIKGGTDPNGLRSMVGEAADRTLRVLKLPSMRYLRATDRHELVRFHRAATAMRNGPPPSTRAARELMDGFGTFLASLQTVELKNRLKDHDKEVAAEALASLQRCDEAVTHNPAQALLFLGHAMRRVARLRGLSTELDTMHAELSDLSSRGAGPSQLRPMLERLREALVPLA